VTLVKSDGDPSAQEREGSRRSEAKADHVLVGNGRQVILDFTNSRLTCHLPPVCALKSEI
jgi:hypothetical protein